MIELQISTSPADQLAGDVVIALFFKDQRPLDGPVALLDWRLDGGLTRLLLDGELSGKAGEHVMMQGNGKLAAEWVLLVGGGKWHGLCRETYAALLCHVMDIAVQAGFKEIAIGLTPHAEADAAALADVLRAALATTGKELRACRLSCAPLPAYA